MQKIDRTGEQNYNISGYLMTIVKYENSRKIYVRFENGFENIGTYQSFKKGLIANKNKTKINCNKKIYEIWKGIMRRCYNEKEKLKWKSYLEAEVCEEWHDYRNFANKNKTKINCNKKIYEIWKGIMRRCYNEKEKLKWKSYLEAEVCEEWHDYRNFAKWYNDNYYQIDNMQMHIDKDILVKGNKIYSPETCVFVPYNINSLFTKGNTMRGDCPIGVNYHKRDKVFYARVRNNKGQRMELGGFSNPTDAFNAYKMAKEQIIKDVANEYKDKIPQRLYEAMIKYEVDITD